LEGTGFSQSVDDIRSGLSWKPAVAIPSGARALRMPPIGYGRTPGRMIATPMIATPRTLGWHISAVLRDRSDQDFDRGRRADRFARAFLPEPCCPSLAASLHM